MWVNREEAGSLQAVSDVDLTLHQQEGAPNASYTFSSIAHVRMEENFIQKMEGVGPSLKGKVYDYYVELISQAIFQGSLAPRIAVLTEVPSLMPTPESQGTGTAAGGQAARAIILHLRLQQEGEPPADRGEPRAAATATRLPAPRSPLRRPGRPACLRQAAGSLRCSRGRDQLLSNPSGPAPAPQVHLDLGSCYEVLTLAKRQNLEALKEEAYKVMSNNCLPYLVLADVCPKEDSGGLCCYDDERDSWHPPARLPPRGRVPGSAICSLFVVSGREGPGHQPSSRVFCNNPLTGIWSEVRPLNQARHTAGWWPWQAPVRHRRGVSEHGGASRPAWTAGTSPHRSPKTRSPWRTRPRLAPRRSSLRRWLRFLLLRSSARSSAGGPAPRGQQEAHGQDGGGQRLPLPLRPQLQPGYRRVHLQHQHRALVHECTMYRTLYPGAFQCAVGDNLIYCVGRRRTLCFLADSVSPRFVPKELQSFPAPQGTLLPTILTLPTPICLRPESSSPSTGLLMQSLGPQGSTSSHPSRGHFQTIRQPRNVA
ncbi:Kelch domain-containing protein 7A [Plecturocebus cupreus]